jgi:predicted DNA binding CopG/RHH family protein
MKTKKELIAPMTDEEEAEMIASTERGEWVSVGNIDEKRAIWQKMAENALAKRRKRISISIPELDLARLKRRAAEEGMPYQTLINSILHKYVS